MTEFDRNHAEEIAARRPIHAVVTETFKPRDEHRGQGVPHLGQSHLEKDRLERAAKAVDQGPVFVAPNAPAPVETDPLTEIEQAFEDLNSEANVARSG